MFNGKIHYKWPFSIAMLVHQRVLHVTVEQKPCNNYSLVKQLRQGQITEFVMVSFIHDLATSPIFILLF